MASVHIQHLYVVLETLDLPLLSLNGILQDFNPSLQLPQELPEPVEFLGLVPNLLAMTVTLSPQLLNVQAHFAHGLIHHLQIPNDGGFSDLGQLLPVVEVGFQTISL